MSSIVFCFCSCDFCRIGTRRCPRLSVFHDKDTEFGEIGCSGDVCTESTVDLTRVGSIETYQDQGEFVVVHC